MSDNPVLDFAISFSIPLNTSRFTGISHWSAALEVKLCSLSCNVNNGINFEVLHPPSDLFCSKQKIHKTYYTISILNVIFNSVFTCKMCKCSVLCSQIWIQVCSKFVISKYSHTFDKRFVNFNVCLNIPKCTLLCTVTQICIFVSLIVSIQAEVETLIIFCTNPLELQQKSTCAATN